jgi:hypothetical protein
MKCPICQADMISINHAPDGKPDVTCSIYQNDSYHNSHYYRYFDKAQTYFEKTEDITLLPFKIRNIYKYYYPDSRLTKDIATVEHVPEREVFSCHIYKHNMFKLGDPNPVKVEGYAIITSLNYHIHVDTEDKLRERIKRIILLS